MIEPADVATALGRPTPTAPATLAQWSMWIAEARMLVRNQLLLLGRPGDLDQLDQETLDTVVRRAVVEVVKQPNNVTQVDIEVDDGRVSKRYESSKGEVTITDASWRLLGLSGGTATPAFSIRPYSRPDEAPC